MKAQYAFRLVLALAVSALLASAMPTTVRAEDAQSVDFVRDVQPILAASCYECHAADAQEGGIRWDRKQAVFEGGDSGEPSVVPGKPDESMLIQLVRGEHDLLGIMPPDGAGEPLAKEQIALLERWIEQGAAWPDEAQAEPERPTHWAFIAPRKPPQPEVALKEWPRGPLDYHVLAKLEAEGLKPSPQADRYTLIRRLYLDLIGIPPTPAEADAFVHNDDPQAYEQLVDKLLASPRFGERWARMWLDVARYADTQGYEKDNRRTIWRYRDWVIRAFNEDMPYDQFTREQLAGDLIPGATDDQILATAFHRNTMTNTEGGTDDEEFRVLAVVDRTNTTGQAFMGLTVGCAQCHTHKFDPVTIREYYQLFAFFNQTADRDLGNEAPTRPMPTVEQREQLVTLRAELERAEANPPAADPEGLERWVAETRAAIGRARTLQPQLAVSREGATLTVADDGSILASGTRPATDVYTLEADAPGTVGALRVDVLPHDSLGGKGPGRTDHGNFVLNDLVAIQLLADGSEHRLTLESATATHEQPDYFAAEAIDGDAGKRSGWAVMPKFGQAHSLVVKVAGWKPEAGSRLRLVLTQSYGNFHTIGHFRIDVAESPLAVAADALSAEVERSLSVAASERTDAQRQTLLVEYQSQSSEASAYRQRLDSIRGKIAAIENAVVSIPVMQELPPERRRTSNVLIRGSFLDKGPEVTPGVPEAFHPFPEGAPNNRLGLAEWIVARDNPLTARVAVNRFWEKIFGLGLVETSEDFGTQGTPPINQPLLDHLAVEFMEDGWSMKRLLRRIVTSATYRQTSVVSPELLERDPYNQLYARGPRFRLEAEMIRDQALAAAGLLSDKMFGPSVMPPQPPGVWQVVYSGDNWKTSTGEDRYRRGLYTFWRRTSPYPSMMAFDAVSREICAVRRLRTNTPLAALVMLNDPVYVEAAQQLARRTLAEVDAPASTSDAAALVSERLEHAFRLVLIRPATEAELERLRAVYEQQLVYYQQHPEEAQQMATDPAGPAPAGTDMAELAAWSIVGNVLLNLDEAMIKP